MSRLMNPRGLLALLMALLVLLGLPSSVSAHAQIEEIFPEDNSVIEQAPSSVAVKFNEPVTGVRSFLRVYGSDGGRVDTSDPRSDDGGVTWRVDLAADVGAGTYITAWQVVSADGHPIKGASTFSVETTEEVSAEQIQSILGGESDGVYDAMAALGRIALYLGMMGALGAALASAVGITRSWRRFALAAAGLGVIGVIAVIASQAALLAGEGISAALDPEVLGSVMATNSGTAAILRVLAIVVALGALVYRRRWVVLGVAMSLAAVSFAIAGHAASLSDARLAPLAAGIHIAAVTLWAGGLIAIQGARDGAPIRRISFLATWAAPLAVLTGVSLTVMLADGVGELWSSRWGVLLTMKVAVVAGMLAIGGYQNRRVVPRLEELGQLQRARRFTAIELVGVMAVAGLTSAMLTTTAPAIENAVSGGIYSDYFEFGDEELNLVVDPARTGRNEIHVYVLDDFGRASESYESVRFELYMPAEEIGPIERRGLFAGPGHWLWTGDELLIPGEWEIVVRGQVDEFSEDTVRARVEVGTPIAADTPSDATPEATP